VQQGYQSPLEGIPLLDVRLDYCVHFLLCYSEWVQNRAGSRVAERKADKRIQKLRLDYVLGILNLVLHF
jgi:hypothetical protein